MRCWRPSALIFLLLLSASPLVASPLSLAWQGRYLALASSEIADSAAATIDHQSLRLMADAAAGEIDGALHLRLVRQPLLAPSAAAPFRWKKGGEWRPSAAAVPHISGEIDRGWLRWRDERYAVTLGRQAIHWGSGRLWQPLNLFGSFRPLDLDTAWLAGVDGVRIELAPHPYAVLTLASLATADGQAAHAAHYRASAAEYEWMALLGEVAGYRHAGGALSGEWAAGGWWLEGVVLHGEGRTGVFIVAGGEMVLPASRRLLVEGYYHSLGADRGDEFAAMAQQRLWQIGLQPQRGQQLVGVVFEQPLNPLWQLAASLLLAPVASDGTISGLGQLRLGYSLGSEAELQLLLSRGRGRRTTLDGGVASEFADQPLRLTLMLSLHF
jgi:hypothetical protein